MQSAAAGGKGRCTRLDAGGDLTLARRAVRFPRVLWDTTRRTG
jgi:hypothetical protein